MLDSGDPVVPMVQGRPRLNKPPLIYWTQSASAMAFTLGDAAKDAIWMYRLPSLLAAIGTVLLSWRIARTLLSERNAFIAAAALAATPMIFWEARQARADMVLVFFTTGAMASLWSLLRAKEKPGLAPLVCLWLCTGLGVLTKGPITPMVMGSTLVVAAFLSGRWDLIRRVKPAMGLIVVIAMGLPWLIAVMHRVGPSNYLQTIMDETLGRSMQAKEGHSGPPGYHALLAMVLLFPASMGLGSALTSLWHAIRNAARFSAKQRLPRADITPDLFLASWLVPSWIIFELVSTKLPHYTMPLTPAAVLLCVRGLTSDAPWAVRTRAAAWSNAALSVFSVVTLLVCLAAWMIASTSLDDALALHAPSNGLMALGALLTVTGTLLMFRMLRARDHALMLAAAVATFGLAAAALANAAPAMSQLWTSHQLIAVVDRVDPSRRAPIAAVGYEEDSLIFETHGRAVRTNQADLGAWMQSHPEGLVCITEEALKETPGLESLGAVKGFNYTKGRWVNVVVTKPTAPSPAR
jgi:hypothetical protein